jgi:hypothetical protein
LLFNIDSIAAASRVLGFGGDDGKALHYKFEEKEKEQVAMSSVTLDGSDIETSDRVKLVLLSFSEQCSQEVSFRISNDEVSSSSPSSFVQSKKLKSDYGSCQFASELESEFECDLKSEFTRTDGTTVAGPFTVGGDDHQVLVKRCLILLDMQNMTTKRNLNQ